jgi:hypothetical protein
MAPADFVAPPRCPKCDAVESHVLTFSTPDTVWHWYLPCPSCGHIWKIPKDGRTSPPALLTET